MKSLWIRRSTHEQIVRDLRIDASASRQKLRRRLDECLQARASEDILRRVANDEELRS